MTKTMKFYPHHAVWELTNRCNGNCIHCGSESGISRKNELTEEEALKLCDELHELGCKHVGIIGGEFFLCAYWEKVTKKLRDLGIAVAHLTNGILLNDENIQRLKNLEIKIISVSIDGTEETHNYLRGVPGLYKKAINNIKNAQKEGFRVGINTALSKRNINELPELFKLMEELNISTWQIQGVEDFGRANKNPELSLTIEDFYNIHKQVAEFRKNTSVNICLGDNMGHFTSFEHLVRNSPFTGCVAGRLNIGIEANGNIRGCLSLRGDENVVGNIRERSLTELWNDPEVFRVFREKPIDNLTGFCRECKYARICRGGCCSLTWSLNKTFYENPMCLFKYEVEQGLNTNDKD